MSTGCRLDVAYSRKFQEAFVLRFLEPKPLEPTIQLPGFMPNVNERLEKMCGDVEICFQLHQKKKVQKI